MAAVRPPLSIGRFANTTAARDVRSQWGHSIPIDGQVSRALATRYFSLLLLLILVLLLLLILRLQFVSAWGRFDGAMENAQ